MAPKRKPVAELGYVERHGKGWRVKLSIDSKFYCGPTHSIRPAAERDLFFARQKKSREEMCDFVRLLHNGNVFNGFLGYQKIHNTSVAQSHPRAFKKAAKEIKSLGAMRKTRPQSKIRTSKSGDASKLAGKSKATQNKASALNETIADSIGGKKLLLQLKKCHYEAIMTQRKMWEARPLLDKTGKPSMFAKLGSVGRIVVLQSGRGTNNVARITEVRKYLGQVNMPPVKEMLLELGADLLPDSPSSLEARINQYAECYSEGWDLDKMAFVALRLELGRSTIASERLA